MFVAINCALDFPEDQKPPWLDAANAAAEADGGLRKATSWRSATQKDGGSNVMPILIGPAVDGAPNLGSCRGYGWVRSSGICSTYVAWHCFVHICTFSSINYLTQCAVQTRTFGVMHRFLFLELPASVISQSVDKPPHRDRS